MSAKKPPTPLPKPPKNPKLDERQLSRLEEADLISSAGNHALGVLSSFASMGEEGEASRKSALNGLLVLQGVLADKKTRDLDKLWSGVDWSIDKVTLADIVVSSLDSEVIKKAPINWAALKTPSRRPDDYTRDPREDLWVVQNLLCATKPFHPDVATRHKFSDIELRTKKTFWGTVFSSGKLDPSTKVPSVYLREEVSLFHLALVYGSKNVLEHCKIDKCIKTKQDAEEAIMCILQGGSKFYRHIEKEYDQAAIEKSLSLRPDFSRKFATMFSEGHRYRMADLPEQAMEKFFDLLEKDQQNFLADFFAVPLGEMIFKNIRREEITQKTRLAFLVWVEEMSEKNQVAFLQGLHVRLHECYDTMLDKKFASDFASRLKPKAREEFFEVFVSDKIFSDKEYLVSVLDACKKINIKKDKDYLISFLNQCQDEMSKDYRHSNELNVSMRPLFARLFPENLQPSFDKIFKFYTSDVSTEKQELWHATMLQELSLDIDRRASPVKKM